MKRLIKKYFERIKKMGKLLKGKIYLVCIPIALLSWMITESIFSFVPVFQGKGALELLVAVIFYLVLLPTLGYKMVEAYYSTKNEKPKKEIKIGSRKGVDYYYEFPEKRK